MLAALLPSRTAFARTQQDDGGGTDPHWGRSLDNRLTIAMAAVSTPSPAQLIFPSTPHAASGSSSSRRAPAFDSTCSLYCDRSLSTGPRSLLQGEDKLALEVWNNNSFTDDLIGTATIDVTPKMMGTKSWFR